MTKRVREMERKNVLQLETEGKRWARSWGQSWGRGQRRTATGIMLKHGLAYWLLPWNLPTYLYLRRVIAGTTALLRGIGCEWQGDTESEPPVVFRYSERHRLERPRLGFFGPGKEAEDARSKIH